MSEISDRPKKSAQWADILGVLGAIAIVLVGWRAVAFEGKTFDASGIIAGVNGSAPPTGGTVQSIPDVYRIDLGASSWQTVPWAEITHRQLASGTLPLWNPYQAAGTPFAANMISSVFDPLLIAVNLHPTPLTWDITSLFAYILGCVATYLFLRMWDVTVASALTGAAAYSLCGYFVINSNNSFVRTYIFIPILLLALEQLSRSGRLRWVAALGAAIAATLLAGMPEAAFFSLSIVGIYAAYRVLASPSGMRFSVCLRLGSSGLLGLALAAPLLVLFLQYLPLSATIHHGNIGLQAVSKETLLNWLAPLLNGYPASQYGGLTADRSWSGSAVIALAIVAVCAPASKRRNEAWLFVVAATAVLLKMHGYPGVQWLGMLPVANLAIWPAFAPPVANFCLAAAAAVGVDAIARGLVRPVRFIVTSGIVTVLVGFLYNSARPILHTGEPGRVVTSFRVALAAGAIVAAAALVSALIPRMRSVAALVVAGTVIAELLTFVPNNIYPVRYDPFLPPPWLELMDGARPVDRVFAFDGVLYTNTAGALGIQDARTIEAMYIRRYSLYIRNFVSTSFTDRFTGEGVKPSEILDNRMFDLLGVRYVMARSTSSAISAETGKGLNLLGMQDGVFVYRNDKVIPRAFVVHDVHPTGEGMNGAFTYLRSHGHTLADGTTRLDDFDPARQAVVEVAAGGLSQSLQGSGSLAEPRPANIVSYSPDRVEVQIPSGSPGLLVLTDTFYPGWVATINGRPAKILPTDVAFRGVEIGAESSTVVFQYRPRTALLGWAIAGSGVFSILAVGVVRRRKRVRA